MKNSNQQTLGGQTHASNILQQIKKIAIKKSGVLLDGWVWGLMIIHCQLHVKCFFSF